MWWVYLAPENIPRAISVLTLGNKVTLYCIIFYTVLYQHIERTFCLLLRDQHQQHSRRLNSISSIRHHGAVCKDWHFPSRLQLHASRGRAAACAPCFLAFCWRLLTMHSHQQIYQKAKIRTIRTPLSALEETAGTTRTVALHSADSHPFSIWYRPSLEQN